MDSNRFFTILIVPEKTSRVRKLIIPSWIFKWGLLGISFAVILAGVMVLDYWYVMSQISENKELKIENRRLRQQVQVFKNKLVTIESTMDRIQSFSTRLKVITNIEDRSGLIQSLNQSLPDSATNIGKPSPTSVAETLGQPISDSHTPFLSLASWAHGENPVDLQLRKDYQELDSRFSEISQEAVLIEQILQDQYELLADQKAFLAALPTRKPAIGYFTSGFGIRKSPYGGRVKMHEGLDIANYPGTPIKATADGTVVFAGIKPGYGQTVIIDHGYGMETWYGHTRKLLTSQGKKVKRGDLIAQMGNSGRSTGPHLHYEVRVNGTPVDPLSYILEN